MAKKDIDLNTAFYMKPDKVIEYFNSKGCKTSFDWEEVYEEAHAKAFTVAKMMDADLLQDTKELVDKAIKEGWGSGQFKTEANKLFLAKGWTGKKEVTDQNTGELKTVELGTPRRIKKIFDCNMRSAYAVGRYREQIEDADIAPYFQYNCVLDNRTRDSHRALNGKIFRYDDPLWQSLYPPNGWNCRCFVKSLTEYEVEKKGLKVEKSGKGLGVETVQINKKGDTKDVAVYKFKDKKGIVHKVKADAGWSTNQALTAYQPDLSKYGFDLSKKITIELAEGQPLAWQYAKAVNWADSAKKELNRLNFANEDAYTRKAAELLQKIIPAEEQAKFTLCGILTSEQMATLDTTVNIVKLSQYSLAKNIARHPDVPLRVYTNLPKIVNSDTAPFFQENRKDDKKNIICFSLDGNYYRAVIKCLNQELFLTSIYKTKFKAIVQECKKYKITILDKNLKHKK